MPFADTGVLVRPSDPSAAFAAALAAWVPATALPSAAHVQQIQVSSWRRSVAFSQAMGRLLPQEDPRSIPRAVGAAPTMSRPLRGANRY